MLDSEIIDQVMAEHPCFATNGVKSYTLLEVRRMIKHALELKCKYLEGTFPQKHTH